jgi:hypothetical protein
LHENVANILDTQVYLPVSRPLRFWNVAVEENSSRSALQDALQDHAERGFAALCRRPTKNGARRRAPSVCRWVEEKT